MISFLKDLKHKMLKELKEEGEGFISKATINSNQNIKTLLKNIFYLDKLINNFTDEEDEEIERRKYKKSNNKDIEEKYKYLKAVNEQYEKPEESSKKGLWS